MTKVCGTWKKYLRPWYIVFKETRPDFFFSRVCTRRRHNGVVNDILFEKTTPDDIYIARDGLTYAGKKSDVVPFSSSGLFYLTELVTPSVTCATNASLR